MRNIINNTIDKFLKQLEIYQPNYNLLDLDEFVRSNDIDFNNFIKSIERVNIDLENRFFNRLNLLEKEKGKEIELRPITFKLFLIFIDYCYFLQIQERKNTKEFIMPSKNSFEYKMNNDIRPAKNITYNADILMFA